LPDWRKAVAEHIAQARLDATSEAEVIEELARHMDDRYEELRASGVSEEGCRQSVLAELDRIDPLIRAARLVHRPAPAALIFGVPRHGRTFMHGTIHDLKMAFRTIRLKPWFSLMVIGMLALGIAGNSAIFSIFDGLVLRPLPFAESDRLVELDETAPKWNLRYVGVANPDFYEWRKSNSTFDAMAFFTGASYNLSDGRNVERIQAAQVTRDMLDVLRLKPMIGRDFRPEEDKPGGAKVVLLNYGFWQRAFQGDSQVLGRIVRLDEQPYMVIGVLPRGAVFPDRVDLWTPLAADPNRPSGYYLNGLGRLKPGASLAQARSDLLRIHKAMISSGRESMRLPHPP